MEPAPSLLPVSFSRTVSNGSSLENMQLAHSAVGSFDGRPPSFSGSAPSPANTVMYANAQSGPVMQAAGYRSFSEVAGPSQHAIEHHPQIYTVRMTSKDWRLDLAANGNQFEHRPSIPACLFMRWRSMALP